MLLTNEPGARTLSRLRSRLHLSAEGAEPAGGGGGEPPAEAPKAEAPKAEPRPQGVDPAEFSALKTTIGELSKTVQQLASPPEPPKAEPTKAKQPAGPDKKMQARLAELEAAAQTAADKQSKALAAAKAAHLKAALPGIKDSSYLKLAPDVELNDDWTGLTEDSQKSLAKWREEHGANLFKTSTGTTPLSGAGAKRQQLSSQDAATLAQVFGGQEKLQKLLGSNAHARRGWIAPVAHQQEGH